MSEHSRSSDQVVVLGGGRGLACVLPAVRSAGMPLTVITSIAIEPNCDEDARQRLRGPVEDLRRSLEALSDQDGALLHAIRRPLTIDGVGEHPLGDLTLTAAADALGGYGRASVWLGDQLGIEGSVFPATIEPASQHIEDATLPALGKTVRQPVRRLRFPESGSDSPEGALAAIANATVLLLAPGGLYRNILSTCAVPDLVGASPPPRHAWPGSRTFSPTRMMHRACRAIDHLLLLRLHEVRVDAVLHDPTATLSFDAAELSALGVASVMHPLQSKTNPGTHDPQLLRAALSRLLRSVSLQQPAA